ncbi:MAG TPA: MBL fold metallo-hydrolase [Bacillales bacterium]|nr:MBL fold metallo-hydrolase [Bacillales bacterium]
MKRSKIGPIEIIPGEHESHVPYCTSLLVHGKDHDALIDCGGGKTAFDYLQKQNIRNLYLTHYHIDHIWGAYLFKDAEIAINTYDRKKLSDRDELARASGLYALCGEEGAKKRVKHLLENEQDAEELKPNWNPVLGITDKVYPYEKEIEIADTKMRILHTPGHTEGYCCPYFPEYGVFFCGDFDLTSFGPWYNDADSDIEQFFKSAERTLEVDAKYYVTAHHKGTFERSEYENRLRRFMDKIREREEKTRKAVQRGILPKDIVYEEIFYYRRTHTEKPHLMESEIIGIAKHLDHLIKQGCPFEAYFEAFNEHFGLHREWLNFRSKPDRVLNPRT